MKLKRLFVHPALSIVITAFISGLIISACSKSGGANNGGTYGNGGGGGNGGGSDVSIKNFAFSVGSLTVNSGTTVTWTNNDAATHTVTADDNSFNSGNIAPGKTYSKTFSSSGTFAYHCTIHPGMQATVVVK
jgi:plastocyanin